jgi:hypothetical protein
VYPLDHLVGDLVVGHVAPPQEHVRGVEDLLGESVFGLVERGDVDLGEVAIPERRRSRVTF